MYVERKREEIERKRERDRAGERDRERERSEVTEKGGWKRRRLMNTNDERSQYNAMNILTM